MNDILLRRIFILAGIALLIWVIYLLQPVVIPFIIAFLIAYLFSPILAQLHKIGIPRWLGIAIVFLSIVFLVVMVAWFLLPKIWSQLLYARDHLPEAIRWLNHTVIPWFAKTFNVEVTLIGLDEISNAAMLYIQQNYSANNIQEFLLRLAQSGLNFIQIGGTAILVPIVAFYFMLDWDKMLAGMQSLIPRRAEAKTVQIVKECHSVLGAFIKGQFLVMFLLGSIYAIGLQSIGLNVGLIIGIIAGLASIIPYLGFAVGIIAAIVATFLQFGLDWMQLVLVAVVFMVGQVIEGYVLQPFLLGDKIGLPPVAVVFAVLAGAQLFGFVGMLIALPVAAILVVLLKHACHSYQNSAFYGTHLEMIPNGITNAEEEQNATAEKKESKEKPTSELKQENTRYDSDEDDEQKVP